MAVKIVRQPKSIALLGAPTSVASLAAGHERAPAALRTAGLVTRLTEAGFAVTDYGDCKTRVFHADDEHPRARNVGEALEAVEELRPKIEAAVKSGALAVVLAGDDTNVLGVIAGARRYYKNVGLIDVDRDVGLNVPASTPSGCLDGMVASHVAGRGAPELVRFWGEPPLVREPDVVIFGIARLDEPEKAVLERSPLRHYTSEDIQRMGAKAAAQQALERVHGNAREFVLHIDLDVIASEDFRATNLSASGGLRLTELRDALAVWARQPNLAALVIAGYNPSLDPDGSSAKQVIDLLAGSLSPRLAPEVAEVERAPETAPAGATASGNNAAQAPEAPASVADEAAAAAPSLAEPESASPPDADGPLGSENPPS